MSALREPLFESSVPFGHSHAEALCLYCSDGRFALQTAEFLRKHLRLMSHDLLAVPGGGAALAGDPAAWREGDVFGECARLLQRLHELKRVVLVAHEDCGFYAFRLGIGREAQEPRQMEDLRKIASAIRAFGSVSVEGYYARIVEGRVRFEAVEV